MGLPRQGQQVGQVAQGRIGGDGDGAGLQRDQGDGRSLPAGSRRGFGVAAAAGS